MEKFTKITVGFVTQNYQKNAAGKFICMDHEFIAGDDVQFENLKGDTIEMPEHEYQPFNMTMLSTQQIIDRLGDVYLAQIAGTPATSGLNSPGFATKLPPQ